MDSIIQFIENIGSPSDMDKENSELEISPSSDNVKAEVNGIVHTRDTTINDKIKCTCGKCFGTETNLSKHVKRLVGKNIACSVCNKMVYSNSDLKRHMVTHSDEKSFSCDKCTASFKLKSELYRHEVIHTGERKFKCSVCKKCFTQSGDLKRHQVIHNNERKYVCSMCPKAFKQNAHLQNHLRRIHKISQPEGASSNPNASDSMELVA